MSNFFNPSDTFLHRPFDPYSGYFCVGVVWAPLERLKILMQTAAKSPYVKIQPPKAPSFFQMAKMVV